MGTQVHLTWLETNQYLSLQITVAVQKTSLKLLFYRVVTN